MTRFIKKDEKTQVNSNLIGVRVIPGVVPPTYEVAELTANVQVYEVECTNKMNGLPMLYVNTGNSDSDGVWAYTGTQEEYYGTVYNVWSRIMGDGAAPNVLTISTDTITDQTQFYYRSSEPGEPIVKVFRSDYMLTYEGDLYRFDPNDTYLYAPESEDTYDLVDGFVTDKDLGQYVGKVVSDSLGNKEFACTYEVEEGGYTYWRLDFGVKIYLFSTVRNPAVGDNLRSNTHSDQEAYLSPVLNVTKEEVDPGHIEDVDCSVSYSVDGETWTDWTENLTDDNNVIANVPRYMFLKFGQDVEITEE